VTDERRRVVRNAGSSYAVRGLLVLSVLLLTPYLFRALGADGFGTWSVMLTVATVFSLLEVAFSTGVTIYVAELHGSGRAHEAGRAVRSGALLMLLLGLVALGVSLAVAFLADGLAAPEHREEFRDGLVVIGLAMLVRFPCVAFGAGLTGWQRYDLFNIAEAITIGGFAAGAVIAIETGGGVLGLAIAHAAALVAGGVAFVVLLLGRAAPGVSLRRGASEYRRLAAFGSWTLLADSMAFAAERMDTIVIAALRGAAAAGPYAAAQKLRSGLQSLTLPLFALLLPMVSELQASGRREEIVRRLVLATRVAIQVSLPVAAAVALFAHDLVGTWLGSGAPDSTATIVAVLMLVEVLALSATPAHLTLIGVGRVRFVGVFGLADGAANVALSIVLVSSYGAVGAAWGTLLTSSLAGLVKIPVAARVVGCTRGLMLARGLAPALVASAPAIAAMVAVRLLLDEGAPRLAIGTIAGLSIAVAVALRQIGPADIRRLGRSLRLTPGLAPK
jgi:O-antigen/teichoic acid export membrane protein